MGDNIERCYFYQMQNQQDLIRQIPKGMRRRTTPLPPNPFQRLQDIKGNDKKSMHDCELIYKCNKTIAMLDCLAASDQPLEVTGNLSTDFLSEFVDLVDVDINPPGVSDADLIKGKSTTINHEEIREMINSQILNIPNSLYTEMSVHQTDTIEEAPHEEPMEQRLDLGEERGDIVNEGQPGLEITSFSPVVTKRTDGGASHSSSARQHPSRPNIRYTKRKYPNPERVVGKGI